MGIEFAARLFDLVEREVWIVTAAVGARRGGLVATFVSSASIVPEMPRLIAGIAKTHETWKLIDGSRAFAAHLIDETRSDLVWRFGLHSSRDADKFDGLAASTAATGSPILSDALAWLDCRVEAEMDIGDRTIFLAEVVDGAIRGDAPPMTTGRLTQGAPADILRTLREQIAAAAQSAAQAIRRWRA